MADLAAACPRGRRRERAPPPGIDRATAPGRTGAPVKILFVVQRYGVEVAGGAERACREYAERLAGRGHRVEVLTTRARSYVDWADEYPPGRHELNGVVVEEFTADTMLSLLPDLSQASNFYGFTNIVFRTKKKRKFTSVSTYGLAPCSNGSSMLKTTDRPPASLAPLFAASMMPGPAPVMIAKPASARMRATSCAA